MSRWCAKRQRERNEEREGRRKRKEDIYSRGERKIIDRPYDEKLNIARSVLERERVRGWQNFRLFDEAGHVTSANICRAERAKSIVCVKESAKNVTAVNKVRLPEGN